MRAARRDSDQNTRRKAFPTYRDSRSSDPAARLQGLHPSSTDGVLIRTVAGQRITTIQLDGVQYFVSRMNPYSPELNYFLAYQYCRSLGLQLTSFESKEKSDSITQYLRNAGERGAQRSARTVGMPS